MALRIFRVAGPMFGSLRREAAWEPGTYLSDGERLLRLIFRLSPPKPTGLAELEDCATGERLLYTGRELWNLWLQPVKTAASRERRGRGSTLRAWNFRTAPRTFSSSSSV